MFYSNKTVCSVTYIFDQRYTVTQYYSVRDIFRTPIVLAAIDHLSKHFEDGILRVNFFKAK